MQPIVSSSVVVLSVLVTCLACGPVREEPAAEKREDEQVAEMERTQKDAMARIRDLPAHESDPRVALSRERQETKSRNQERDLAATDSARTWFEREGNVTGVSPNTYYDVLGSLEFDDGVLTVELSSPDRDEALSICMMLVRHWPERDTYRMTSVEIRGPDDDEALVVGRRVDRRPETCIVRKTDDDRPFGRGD
jgi:hypothetical protein